jgi:DNA-binding NtrC family response regulator
VNTPRPPRDASTAGASSPPPTILVVDDEAPLRHVLERALRREGYQVLGAASAETAYELLATAAADAVLLDIRLPTMSGLALYLAMVHRWPALEGRIAVMTGDAEADEVRTWLERNRCTVIRKPFNLREIFDWLRSVLEQRDRGTGNG